MNILFVDPTCYKPYDATSLDTEPLGGTEATVIRIAESLASRGHTVRVAQHNRTVITKQGAEYCGFGQNLDFKPNHIVVLRAPLVLDTARKQYPSAKLYFWAHDIFGGEGWGKGCEAILRTGATVLVVSKWHESNFLECAHAVGSPGPFAIKVLANPISDDLKPDATPVDNNKMVFFSSPHKGLEHTLNVFDQFKNFKELQDVILYIANPGYFPDSLRTDRRNCVWLGPLSHRDVLAHVRSSLCVLHLNSVYPETFGLVHAESNAVGTPFLNHKLGAVPETADHHHEMIDVKDQKAVIERLIQWRTIDRPRVRANPNFRLTAITKKWLEVLR
jgi:glycosyltransferase involved in cell wall biosynthesis